MLARWGPTPSCPLVGIVAGIEGPCLAIKSKLRRQYLQTYSYTKEGNKCRQTNLTCPTLAYAAAPATANCWGGVCVGGGTEPARLVG